MEQPTTSRQEVAVTASHIPGDLYQGMLIVMIPKINARSLEALRISVGSFVSCFVDLPKENKS